MCSKDIWQQGNMLLIMPLMEKKDMNVLYTVWFSFWRKNMDIWIYECTHTNMFRDRKEDGLK